MGTIAPNNKSAMPIAINSIVVSMLPDTGISLDEPSSPEITNDVDAVSVAPDAVMTLATTLWGPVSSAVVGV